LHLGWSSREAPLTARFTLGDKDGFAGFHIGEKLANTETVLQTDLGLPLRGPLQAIATVMGGQVSSDPARPLSGSWYTGARLGLGADSPLGPLRLQYGVNNEGRTAWYFRIGRWF
jgi:outer membrane translocation and assembly module TamA